MSTPPTLLMEYGTHGWSVAWRCGTGRWTSVPEALKLLAPWLLYRIIWIPLIRFMSTQSAVGRWNMSLPAAAFTSGCVALLASLAINRCTRCDVMVSDGRR